MSDRAQRVLDALMFFDDVNEYNYPLKSLHAFIMDIDSYDVDEDYKALTADEEKEVIQTFLKLAY